MTQEPAETGLLQAEKLLSLVEIDCLPKVPMAWYARCGSCAAAMVRGSSGRRGATF